jgi:hypothetical protein
VTAARYALGIASLLAVIAGHGYAATTLRRWIAPQLTGPTAHLAEAVLALTTLIAMSELLGTVGLFHLGPLVAASVITGTTAAVWQRRSASPRASGTVGSHLPGGRPLPLIVAGAAVLAVGAEWLAPTLTSYDIGIRTFDSLWYHLPWAASFAQSGNVASLRFTDVEYLTAFYPATGELLHGAGIVLLGRDTLSPLLNLGFMALTLLGAWCAGRPRGVAPLTLLGAALALAVPMVRFSQAGSAANDIVGIFFLIASVALVLNAGESRGVLLLATLSAGLAVSVKLSLLAPVLALAAGAILTARAGPRRAATIWIPALIAAGGYWYARNLVLVGNPLPWLHLGFLASPAAALQQHTGFSVAHYVLHGSGWSRWFRPGLESGLGPLWPLVLAAAIAAPIACLARGPDRTTRMLGAVALLSIVAYLITPESAAGPAGRPSGFAFNLRYAAPALTLALTVGPLVLPEAARNAALGVLGLLLAVTLSQARLWPAGYGPAALAVVAGAAGP